MPTVRANFSVTNWRDLKSAPMRVLTKLPNLADRLKLHGIAMSGAYASVGPVAAESAAPWHQVMTTIRGWEGVADESEQPLAFTEDNLRALCDQYPAILRELLEIADGLYSDAGTAEKN